VSLRVRLCEWRAQLLMSVWRDMHVSLCVCMHGDVHTEIVRKEVKIL